MKAPLQASSELAAQIAADRTARPWLYADSIEEARSDRAERMAPIGVPIAVKIGVAIGQARRREQLAQATVNTAQALAQGLIDQIAAQAITAAVAEKSDGLRWHREWWNRIAPPRIVARVSDRRPRIEHRAKLAASGPMPPDLAKRFTVGELAVMKIIADEVSMHGTCRKTKKEIGDRARASETTVHNAARKAERLGLISVKRRPVQGRKSLPNLIVVINPEWALWIARPKYRAIREDRQQPQQTQGANPSTPQSVSIYKKDTDGVWRDPKEADRGEQEARDGPQRASP